MKKIDVSVLITNYNKEKFVKNSVKSCINQKFLKKEILVYDDCSTESSLKILKKFKKIKLIKNKKKKFKSGPLNQINGIKKLIKFSRGEIIFLLDSDDEFYSNKIQTMYKKFKSNPNVDFLQDLPFYSKKKKKIILKSRNSIFTIWPRFYPTSTMVMKKKFLKEFFYYNLNNSFPNLEIDARIAIFAYLKNKFSIINSCYTKYNLDLYGISSMYEKYSKKWWIKRYEAFCYMKYLSQKLKKRFYKGPDYYFTVFINSFF